MLRSVLLCLDERSSGRMSLEAALRFAGGYGASLSGLVVREPPVMPVMMRSDMGMAGGMSPGNATMINEIVRDHESRQDMREEQLIHGFRESCVSRGLTATSREASGDPRDEIPRAARAFDLVISGRGDRPDDVLGSVAGALVRNLSCPVMLLSGDLPPLSVIAVAYDGSHGADRALALAADVATHWKGNDVTVVLIGVGTADSGVREALADAERYLDVYHLGHRTHVVEGPAAVQLVETARREKADLLVMGAYGHSRLREMLLGSTTREVIDTWKGALLLWR